MNGFLNILKPPGMTSAAVVAVVRRLTGEKHVGHAGTLDPEAAGVLPVMVGKAARLFDYLVDKEKTYVAEAAFGCATDTQDATGTVTAEGSNYPSFARVEEATAGLTGDIWQRPSVFSAIKQDGKPLYERAHRGETVEVPLRQVHVESIQLHGEMPGHGVLMTVRCGRGTYIRSICNDLGEKVGCPAHMRFLLRAQSGAFDLSTACTLEELKEHLENGTVTELLIPVDAPVRHLPQVSVPGWLEKQVRNGARLPVKKLSYDALPEEGKPVRVYWNGSFWGIACREGDDLVWQAQIAPETGSVGKERSVVS